MLSARRSVLRPRLNGLLAGVAGATAVLVAVLLIPGLGGSSSARAATARCVEAVRVIAARGSGDPEEGSPGTVLKPFIAQLENQGDPGQVNGEGLNYPAVAVVPSKLTIAASVLGPPGVAEAVLAKKIADYKHSVDIGVDHLVKVVKERASRCPDVKLVLAGYSQGAHVVRDALNRLGPLADHIGAIALFGDPHFDSDSNAAVKGGTFDHHAGLLGTVADFPAAFRPHIATYCLRHDLICQRRGSTAAHKRYVPTYTEKAAETLAGWLGLRRTRTCAPATNIAAILDDSGSMEVNDPLNIRAAAMQLLISEPGGGGRTLGAIEFGDEAGPLFDPQPIAQGEAQMIASLGALADDGFAGTGTNTNYNAAFAETKLTQPSANARIFLTDGENTEDPYENGHLGGPRTFVIGLNMGPAGEGSEPADLLGRIASETGGVYYPLKRAGYDEPSDQIRELQPVFNSIDAELECQIAPSQAVRTLTAVGAPTKPATGKFLGNPGVQAVITWTTLGAVVDITGAAVRNPNGGLVANLTGKAPKGHGHKHRRIGTLAPSVVSGATFRTVTIPRPKHGSTISIRIAASQLAEPTIVTVQLSPVESLPQGSAAGTPASTTVVPPAPAPEPAPPAPPAPANHVEQETPNHPVNTFTNYHNASGMGPAIGAGAYVEVSCRVYDPTIASVNPDGYWYRIASSPWNNAYYSPANTFMNGDPYGGPYTHNTDFSVPVC